MERDHYSVLGVSRFVSQDALRRAFRLRILQIHPDTNPTDNAAADHARRVIEAYEVLRDSDSRRRYDRALAKPVYVMTPHSYEAACPLWVTRFVVLALFFAMSAGLVCVVAESVGGSTQAFHPIVGVTSVQAVPDSSAASSSGDQSISLGLDCLEEARSPDLRAPN